MYCTDQDIFQLDVSMDQTLTMQEANAFNYINSYLKSETK